MAETSAKAWLGTFKHAVVPSTIAAVAVSVVMLIYSSWLMNDLDDEVIFGVIFVGILMTLLSVVVAAVVYQPVMLAMSKVTDGRRERCALIGAACLPLAMGASALVGTLIPGVVPITELFGRIVERPIAYSPLLLGFLASGVVFGLRFADGSASAR